MLSGLHLITILRNYYVKTDMKSFFNLHGRRKKRAKTYTIISIESIVVLKPEKTKEEMIKQVLDISFDNYKKNYKQ